MQSVFRASMPLVMALALAACGGGGGSSTASGPGGTGSAGNTGSSGTPSVPDTPLPKPDGTWLSFTPSTIAVSGYEGESIPFTITAASSRTFSKAFNIAVVDASGTITADAQIAAVNELTYTAKLHTSPKLTAGTKQVNLEVRLCEDAPATCNKPLPGSPWYVPLKVELKPASDAAKRLALSTASFEAVSYPGEQATLYFGAEFKGDLVGQTFQVGIVDMSSLSNSTLVSSPDGFKATLKTSASLQIGEYNSNVEVRLCRDDPRTCSMPVPGSPWVLPLKLSVKNPVNLTALTPVPSLGAWSTTQGNAAHTGSADASFNVANFSRRFNIPASSPNHQDFYSVATNNGKVFMVSFGGWFSASELIAISEADGSVAWRTSLGALMSVSPPAAANGFVYLTSSTDLDSYIWMFDQQTGQLLSKAALGTKGPDFQQAPTPYGTDVYSVNLYSGLISKFSSVTKGRDWLGIMPPYYRYTPAVDGTNAYGYAKGLLRALSVSDGQLNWEITDPEFEWDGYDGRTPALSGNLAIVLAGGRLMGFDTALRTRAWSVKNSFTGQPAIGNGLVYAPAANGTVLEARSLADGKLQWTSENLGDRNFQFVLVTRNLAFVSSTDKTVAIDLSTQKVVWNYPRGGSMAISGNGVLYILTDGGHLSAINLK